MTNLTRRLALTALIVFAPAALAAQQAAFTLDQVMSPPFPDELVAAPRGGAVAWVFNARGARNIWVAAPPDYRGKAITSYPEDDGQELTDLRWTPDGRAIVYVRGGGANGKGEYPNPHSLVTGVEQGLWIVTATGGATPRHLSEGHSPAVSPKGDRVAFLRHGQGWWASLSATAGQAEQLIHSPRAAGARPWARRRGCRAARVAQRPAHRLRTASRGGGRAAVHAPAGRPAVVDPRAGRGERRRPPGVGRRHRPGQRVPRDRRPESDRVGRRGSHRVCVGAGRLDTPIRGSGERRPGHIAHAGRVRGRARGREPRRRDDRVQLEPGRHRAAPHLEGGGHGGSADGAHPRHRSRMDAGRDGGRTGGRLHPGGDADATPPRPDRHGRRRAARSRSGSDSRGVSRGRARGPAAGAVPRRRRHDDPRPAVPAARDQARGAPPGGRVLPRGLTTPDAARLALLLLLSQCLRPESVPREPGLRGRTR